MTAHLFVRPQDLEDEIKMDPVQAAFREEFDEEEVSEEDLLCGEGCLTKTEVKTILNQEGVPKARYKQIWRVLFSKESVFNREPKEEPVGLRIEIPEGAAQFLELAN